jgi:CheY-like chemotaxis protein
LEVKQVEITTTARVDEALHLIDSEPFDVLLSDLHMTETGDGLAAISAMHNKNPDALTLVYTGYPELKQALDAILLRSDEVSVSPRGIPWLPEPIHEKLEVRDARLATNEQRVAAILERDVFLTIIDWQDRVERDDELTCVPLSKADRTGYLPRLIVELAHRLRAPRKPGAKAASDASVEHGKLRQLQGYWISMVVEEFRITQLCIFETLYNSLSPENFRLVLSEAKTITDECNSQLKQTLASFMRQAARIAA